MSASEVAPLQGGDLQLEAALLSRASTVLQHLLPVLLSQRFENDTFESCHAP